MAGECCPNLDFAEELEMWGIRTVFPKKGAMVTFDQSRGDEHGIHAPYEIPDIEDNAQWLINMYHNILLMKDVDENDDGHKYWIKELEKGTPRSDIENYFRQVALKENKNKEKVPFEDVLDKDDKGKRILYVMPESIGDVLLSTSLFKSIKEQYPEYNLYVATQPQYQEILDGVPYVHKIINYVPQMDNLLWLEGKGDHEGFFEIAYLPHIGTQRMLNYLHNGKDKIAYKDLCYA